MNPRKRASAVVCAWAALVACKAPEPAPLEPEATPLPSSAGRGASAPRAPGDLIVTGARLPGGGTTALVAQRGTLSGVGDPASPRSDLDAAGRYAVPAFIDSHVHLTYLPEARGMLRGGVAVAVDLGAPLASLSVVAPEGSSPLVVPSGPMLTAIGGYPTRDWGAEGYGLEVDDVAGAEAAVGRLQRAGAKVLKVAMGEPPTLDDEVVAAAVRRAHDLGMKVVAHALDDRAVTRAARAGVDALAHAPPAPLSSPALDAWRGRAVISTLAAFGGGTALRMLRERGTLVLYGTDFGNTRAVGISGREIDALVAAGLDGRAILESATLVPARFWGLERHGALQPGKAASFLLVRENPWERPATLAAPDLVVIEGRIVHERR